VVARAQISAYSKLLIMDYGARRNMRSEDENEKNTWFTGFHKRPGKAEN